MPLPPVLRKSTETFVMLSTDRMERHNDDGPLFFLASDDLCRARAVACEVSRLVDPDKPLPLFTLSGTESDKHRRLFSDQERQMHGELLPKETPIVLLIEEFDQVPRGKQRGYAHLVEGTLRGATGSNISALPLGSVLLLHVATDAHGRIEVGTLDRGSWIEIETD